MRRPMFLFALLSPAIAACGNAGAVAPEAVAVATTGAQVPAAEIFAAAGFTLADGKWGKCGDPGTLSYGPGTIAQQGDFNGDGHPDAIVVEGGTYCFGMTGTGYTLVSRQADGSWTIIDERQGMLTFLETRGSDGWPDIEVGGPGFCFPVIRWNGSEYAHNRSEYEGKPCQM